MSECIASGDCTLCNKLEERYCCQSKSISTIISTDLNLPCTLRDRINVTVDACLPNTRFKHDTTNNNSSTNTNVIDNNTNTSGTLSYILYLPTVVLRSKHNPAFALACHLANKYHVPLIVLVVIVDDAYYPLTSTCHDQTQNVSVVTTSRRLAFVLQALQTASKEWSNHGATVLIRVHGTRSRTPHQLTLATKTLVVVTERMNHLFILFVNM